MLDLQLTQVALVGARMPVFQRFGYNDRNQLTMHRVSPLSEDGRLLAMTPAEQRSHFLSFFPVWVHNIIVDPGFPDREVLLQPLRRFEGELRDARSDEVVSTVLSAGFQSRPLDPLNLPDDMPLRQRCVLVMSLGIWQEAFRELQDTLVSALCDQVDAVDDWLESLRVEGNALLD